MPTRQSRFLSRLSGRPAGAASTKAGFTLVELVTAAAIMSIVMLGVIEIFSIVTRTAAEAEVIHGASQQMRATLDRLNRDVRGMTREGYLRITPNVNENYHSDLLTFVTIGQAYGTFDDPPPPAGSSHNVADAAEVVYTTNVATPTAFLRIDDQLVDPRRGVLARSTWLMSGTVGTASETQDTSKAAWLGNLYGSTASARGVQATKVWPFLPGDSSTSNPDPSLRRVMATGVSEFFVEYWDDSSSSASQHSWKNVTKDCTTGKAWPKGLRVTVAVHDPTERGPPTSSNSRYEGYVFQEVYCIGAP
ncbi:MAG: type II secretion system protein [Phycisphaerae bacterium]